VPVPAELKRQREKGICLHDVTQVEESMYVFV
jgi:hypothetical protein